MGMIRTLAPWESQPQERAEFGDSGAAFAVNFITRSAPNGITGLAQTNTDQTEGFNAAGRGVFGVTDTTRGAEFTSSEMLSGTANFTVICVGSWASRSVRQTLFLYGNEVSASASQHTIAMNVNSGASVLPGTFSAWTFDTGFTTQVQSNASLIDGRLHVIGWRNGASPTLWMDGSNVTLSVGSSGGTFSGSYPVIVNQGTDPSVSPGRSILEPTNAAFVFLRLLSDTEMLDYTSNPWALYEPRQIWVPSTVASGFNPAWARGSNQLIGSGLHVS